MKKPDPELLELPGPEKGSPSTLTLMGEIEGWVALLLIVFLFVDPAPSRFPIWEFLFSILIGIAFGCAIGGIRFGRHLGRLAAGVALIILSSLLALIVFRGIENWGTIRHYWGF